MRYLPINLPARRDPPSQRTQRLYELDHRKAKHGSETTAQVAVDDAAVVKELGGVGEVAEDLLHRVPFAPREVHRHH